MAGRRLALEERQKIEVFRGLGFGVRNIAERIERCPSTAMTGRVLVSQLANHGPFISQVLIYQDGLDVTARPAATSSRSESLPSAQTATSGPTAQCESATLLTVGMRRLDGCPSSARVR